MGGGGACHNRRAAGGEWAVIFPQWITSVVIRQFGNSRVDAVALDRTICGQNPNRPALFNFLTLARTFMI
jgi:hypothetical protein